MSETSSTAERASILWSFARPYLPALLAALLLGLLTSAMTLVSPLVTEWVLETLAVGGSLRDPILILLVLLVLGAGVGRMTPAFVPLWAEKSSESGENARVIAG